MPAAQLKGWAELEDDLSGQHFAGFGEPSKLIRPDSEPVPVLAIIDPSVGVPDDNGFIKETRCEISLPAQLTLNRGNKVLTEAGKEWDLLKLISDDGQEQVWIAVPARTP